TAKAAAAEQSPSLGLLLRRVGRNVVRVCALVRLAGCRDVLVREAEALALPRSGAVPCLVASGASAAAHPDAAEDVPRAHPLLPDAGAEKLVGQVPVFPARACFP